MKTKQILLSFLLNLIVFAVQAQSINSTASYKNINADTYFRLNYENDFFGFTDEYYTQGINAELVAPWVKDFPLTRVLLHPAGSIAKYGLSIEHNGFTPSSISSDAILYNDRPFAATLFLKTFAITIDTIHKSRLNTTLSTGIIGPGAGGKEMQTYIHRHLNNIMPHGWENQVSNDVILNYEIEYERQLAAYRNIFMISANGIARAGTLSDKAAAGITMMLGYFDSPFGSAVVRKNNFRIYAYEHVQANVIGYDATLQGGLFNNKSPYTIAAKDISRGVLENRFGFVVVYRRFFLEYFQSLYGREFKQGKIHNFGGVQLALGL